MKAFAGIMLAGVLLGCGGLQALGQEPAPGAGGRMLTNPLKSSGPDPWVVTRDGWYYYMNSTGSNLTIWKTRRIEDLANAEKKVVWTPPAGEAYSKELWAPELHWIGGKWYIYFAADAGHNEDHRIYVVENGSADPTEGTWTLKGKVADATNKWAIDATILEPSKATGGKMYMVWSGWEGDTNGVQSIYLAQMKNPWTVEGRRTRISTPEYAWEKVGDLDATDGRTIRDLPHVDVNEGPEVLEHGDKVFVVYSGSACWTNYYELGMVTASLGSNLLDAASWKKSAEPLFRQDPEGKAFGTGHNGFFVSPDGRQNWIIYHANPGPNQGCGNLRSPRAQPFTWKADGTPDFGRPVPVGQAIPVPSGEK
ncbi:MAG: glycoside hydrolase family 43 protein [Acidobacteriaceae bacterium]